MENNLPFKNSFERENLNGVIFRSVFVSVVELKMIAFCNK